MAEDYAEAYQEGRDAEIARLTAELAASHERERVLRDQLAGAQHAAVIPPLHDSRAFTAEEAAGYQAFLDELYNDSGRAALAQEAGDEHS